MSDIRGLYIQFAAFQRQTQKQIKALQKEVHELREIVASQEQREQDQQQPATKQSIVTRNASTKIGPEVRLEPITYAEAFSMIGGTKALAKQAERSRQLSNSVSNANLQSELSKLFESYKNKRTGFSTNLINQKYVATLEELYSQAESVLGGFSDMLYELAGKCHNCKAVVGPLKSKMRAKMKGAFKYRNPHNNTISWYRLTDLVRGTLEFTNIEDLYDGLEILIRQFGDNVKELNDRYQKPLPGGYRDIQVTIQFQGHMCEIQLNTTQMMQAKATTGHRNYAVYRELKSAVDAGDINRVLNAFEFGREHLGATVDGDDGEPSGMHELLQGDAGTLIHTAATQGYAEILHAFLLYGADYNLQDENGDTALHLATFNGHESCVWVLTHEGKADLDIKNKDGHTALVRGYLMLWQRPPEAKLRAVSTLAQVCGVERIKEAKAIADASIGSQLHQSRSLADNAADGNISKVTEKLREWGDPMSKDASGNSALSLAIANGHRDVVELLVSYRAFPKTDEMCTAIKYNRESLWEILVDLCDVSSLDAATLVKAAHESGLSFFREWLQRLSYQYDFDLSKFGLEPPFNGIFTLQNAFPNHSGYLGFTGERKIRAMYGIYEAMPIELVPTGEPDIYKLRNRWPGENKWIALREEKKLLYANFSEEEAMPVKFFPTAEANVYLMKDWTGGKENQWISFMNDGKWVRAIYDNEHDAMPVRLSFKTSAHSKHHAAAHGLSLTTSEDDKQEESKSSPPVFDTLSSSEHSFPASMEQPRVVKPQPERKSRSGRRRSSKEDVLENQTSAVSPTVSTSSRRKRRVDPLSQSEHSFFPPTRGEPQAAKQQLERKSRPGRRRLSKEDIPVLDEEMLTERPLDEKPSVRSSKSSSTVKKIGSGEADASSVRRTKSASGGSKRRAKRKSAKKTGVGANVDEAPSKPPALSEEKERGRATESNEDPKERVDKRLEWRSKSRSRRNLMESTRSRRNLMEDGEEPQPKSKSLTPRRSRPALSRAESLNGQRLSQLNCN